MISKQELLNLATDFGLLPDVVEKDYVLGWVLAALGQHPDTRDTWLFKGGTCLKKCYFETYRFSEDLDFTLQKHEHLDEEFLEKLFHEIADWVYDQTGIVLPPEARKVKVYKNPRGGISAQGRIGYQGPLGRAGDVPRIKLDLTDDECVVLDPDHREVHHPYSDRPADGIKVTTYCFEEVFAEKTRALAERLRPRDLYDVVHLHRRQDLAPNRAMVISTLTEKCAFKKIAVPTFRSVSESPLVAELKISWEQMLGHQLPALPSFESFWDELPDVFSWLYETKPQVQMSAAPTRESIDTTWHPPAMATSWRSIGISAPLEIIRFAASNRLCVALDYQNARGEQSIRLIEPYSLRRSSAGDLLLMAAKASTGEMRSYRVDRIIGATASQKPFTPRYLIELSDSAPFSAPSLEKSKHVVSQTSAWSTKPPARRIYKSLVSKSSFAKSPFAAKGPTHVYRCSVCGKTFNRQKYDSTLNPHKNKNKQPCYGQYGVFVKTMY